MSTEQALFDDGFTLVYQSGHQNVYCDGTKHVWTEGGWAGQHPFRELRRGKCDCVAWRTPAKLFAGSAPDENTAELRAELRALRAELAELKGRA